MLPPLTMHASWQLTRLTCKVYTEMPSNTSRFPTPVIKHDVVPTSKRTPRGFIYHSTLEACSASPTLSCSPPSLHCTEKTKRVHLSNRPWGGKKGGGMNISTSATNARGRTAFVRSSSPHDNPLVINLNSEGPCPTAEIRRRILMKLMAK